MKKLVIEEIKNGEGNVYAIRIIEQSHHEVEFGDGVGYFDHEGFRLSSISIPEVIWDVDVPCGLFVRGDDPTSDWDEIQVPNQIWLEKLRKAVAAYNTHFKNCEQCTERHCNTCELRR
jgi:hypothetical protein